MCSTTILLYEPLYMYFVLFFIHERPKRHEFCRCQAKKSSFRQNWKRSVLQKGKACKTNTIYDFLINMWGVCFMHDVIHIFFRRVKSRKNSYLSNYVLATCGRVSLSHTFHLIGQEGTVWLLASCMVHTRFQRSDTHACPWQTNVPQEHHRRLPRCRRLWW